MGRGELHHLAFVLGQVQVSGGELGHEVSAVVVDHRYAPEALVQQVERDVADDGSQGLVRDGDGAAEALVGM